MGGWEAEGLVWVHSELPGREAGHPSVMASHGSIPFITGDSVGSTAAQVGGRVGGWEAGGQPEGLGVECQGDHMSHQRTPEGHITAYYVSIPHVGDHLCRIPGMEAGGSGVPGMGAGGKEGLGEEGRHPLILGR